MPKKKKKRRSSVANGVQDIGVTCVKCDNSVSFKKTFPRRRIFSWQILWTFLQENRWKKVKERWVCPACQ